MRSCWLFVFLALCAVGCGGGESPKNTAPPSGASTEVPTVMSPVSESSTPSAEGKSKAKGPGADGVRRKLIYTATVELVVEDFDPVQARVESLVKQFDGYLGHSTVSGSPGHPRSGQWTIRVPVEHFEAFLTAVRQVGEVQSVSSDSKDITEEYYDVEARIRNKKQDEARLLKLLADATGKLEEIVAVEKELSRVRGEIEQLEGRLRVLNDLSTLSTVTLRITEVKEYAPREAATYSTRVRRAFEGSINAVVFTAREFSILVVALLPWLVVLLVPAAIFLLLVRWGSRRRRS